MTDWHDDEFDELVHELGENRLLHSFVSDLLASPAPVARLFLELGLDRRKLGPQRGRQLLRFLLRSVMHAWLDHWTDPTSGSERFAEAANVCLQILRQGGVPPRTSDAIHLQRWIETLVARLPSPLEPAAPGIDLPAHILVIFLHGQNEMRKEGGDAKISADPEDERRWKFMWFGLFERRLLSDQLLSEKLGITQEQARRKAFLTPTEVAKVLDRDVESVYALQGNDPAPSDISALAVFGYRPNLNSVSDSEAAAAMTTGTVQPDNGVVESGFRTLLRRLRPRRNR